MRGRWWWRGEAGDNSSSSLGGGGGQKEVVGLGLPYGRLGNASLARMRCSASPASGSGLLFLTGNSLQAPSGSPYSDA